MDLSSVNWKRLGLEYIMGLAFFASGVSATHYQVTRDPADLLVSIGLNIAGYVLYRNIGKGNSNEQTKV